MKGKVNLIWIFVLSRNMEMASFKYSNFKQFQNDFNLMINNCLEFNQQNQYFYKFFSQNTLLWLSMHKNTKKHNGR